MSRSTISTMDERGKLRRGDSGIMKHSFCFFAGGALVSAAVVYAGGKPAGMFIAGGLAAVVFVLCGSRIAGFARVGRFFLALDGALNPQRAATPGRRKNHNTHATMLSFQKTNTDVLKTTQREVVSALCNLGMSLSKAEQLVLEASQGRPGIDFDTLFRMCMTPARKAATA